jgi:hypothetical protein
VCMNSSLMIGSANSSAVDAWYNVDFRAERLISIFHSLSPSVKGVLIFSKPTRN